jgi:putative membrane protein
MMRNLKLFFYGLLILIFIIFLLQNYSTLTSSHSLRLNLGVLLLESVPLPFYLVVVLTFFSGLFLAALMGVMDRRRLTKELKEVRNLNLDLEKKLKSLTPPRETPPAPSDITGLSGQGKRMG